MKKASNMDELESARRMMERNVLTQPLSTAGPMWVTASWVRLLRSPAKEGRRHRLQRVFPKGSYEGS